MRIKILASAIEDLYAGRTFYERQRHFTKNINSEEVSAMLIQQEH